MCALAEEAERAPCAPEAGGVAEKRRWPGRRGAGGRRQPSGRVKLRYSMGSLINRLGDAGGAGEASTPSGAVGRDHELMLGRSTRRLRPAPGARRASIIYRVRLRLPTGEMPGARRGDPGNLRFWLASVCRRPDRNGAAFSGPIRGDRRGRGAAGVLRAPGGRPGNIRRPSAKGCRGV